MPHVSEAPPKSSLDLRDHILTLRGGLPEPLGRSLIEEFAIESEQKPSLVGYAEEVPDLRCSRQTDILKSAARIGTPPARTAARQLKNLIHDWLSAYQCHTHDRLQLTDFSPPSLIRYGAGDHFVRHTDDTEAFRRVVSVIALLPSTFEGGDLTFFENDEVADLQPGDVCLFPSNFLFPHSVQPVVSGERYSVVTWLR